MKKLLSMVLAGMMVLSLAACSGNEVQESSQPEASSSAEQVSESEAPLLSQKNLNPLLCPLLKSLNRKALAPICW